MSDEWQPAVIASFEALSAHPPWPGCTYHLPNVVERHHLLAGKPILVKPTTRTCYCGAVEVEVEPESAVAAHLGWCGGVPVLCVDRIHTD